MPFGYAPLDAYDDKLIHAYPQEDASGDSTDEVGATDLTATNNPGSVAGKNNNARSYNGTDQDHRLAAGLTNASEKFAISGWFNADTLGGGQNIITQYNGGDAFPQITLGNPDKIGCFMKGTSGGEAGSNGSTSLSTGTYYHIVLYCNVDTGDFTLFLNGSSEVSATFSGSAQNPGTFRLASRSAGSPNYFDGIIDEVYVWSDIDLTGGTDLQDFVDDLYNGGSGRFWLAPVVVSDSDVIASETADVVNAADVIANESVDIVGASDVIVNQTAVVINAADIIANQSTKVVDNADTLINQSMKDKQYHVRVYQEPAMTLVDSGAIFDPTTTFSGSVPGDGDYIAFVESDEWRPNTMRINGDTFIRFTVTGGNVVIPLPNAPTDLQAEPRAGAKALVSWRYNANDQQIAPDTFYVYSDDGLGGPIDYLTPINTVNYVAGKVAYDSLVTLTDATYKLAVRAGNGANLEQNTNFVTVTADGTPPVGVPFNWSWA